ncbi:MAG: hypothetical protein L6R38_004518 [Xanthoria sp. 2 TBL-2021]|nr:MAG: hypothetical protein L6R38_004518 [Xanthoria sp. 2 TBL-2021]
MPLPFPFEYASDPEPYTRTVATPPTEMSDFDPSLRASWANPLDVDATYPGPNQNPVLRGGQAGSRSSALGRGHQNVDPRPLSHSHPDPKSFPRHPTEREFRTDQKTSGIHNRIPDQDPTIDVTTVDHRFTGSAQHHDAASVPMDIDDNGMFTDLPNHLISSAPTSFGTHPTPSFVRCPATGSKSGNSRAAHSTILDNDTMETTATAKFNASMCTPLRQAHLNTLLASLIPSAPPSPRASNGEKPEDDPFDNFNSGSEQEDESDIDFKSGSVSPSVRSKSPSPVPTPPESDYEEITRGKQPARPKAQATTDKQPPRQKAQATPIKKKPRTSGFGDWPVAAQARRRSATVTDSPVTIADHDYDIPDPSMRISTSSQNQITMPKDTRLQHTPGGRANKRSWTQMLESEADADREVQMLETMEKEKGMSLSRVVQRPSVQAHDDGEIRNGSGWTLMVEKDRHGRKIVRWMVC